jgi:DNA-binding transcriptional MerR regulator
METHEEQPRYNLSELTDEAGVSVRTVRYYIAEGLLPPPVTAGPRSFYTQSHLDRLRLIDRLKTSYLPLKEIRRRLTALDDDEVRRLLEPDAAIRPAIAPAARTVEESPPAPPDSASSYIARLLHRPAPAAAPKPAPPPQLAMRMPEAVRVEARTPNDEPADPFDFMLAESAEDTGTWRRIPLGDDAELVIRDELYQRKRDRVEWLVGWARKVFG